MIYIILFLLGLSLGSFINALVWRIHKQEKSSSKKYSVLRGHSMCPNCKHNLAWYDLIPVFSWLSLKGRCRYCKKSISWQYPVVELITALLFVISYIFWPKDFNLGWQYIDFVSWLIILTGLISLAIYDIKWMLLPDKIIKPLLIIVSVSLVLQVLLGRSIKDVWIISLATAIGGGIFWILYQLSKGRWIGGGDVKLGFLLGLILAEPVLAILYIFLASILGFIYSMPLLLSRKIKPTSRVPFGPFLIAGAIIVELFGSRIINSYLSIILIK